MSHVCVEQIQANSDGTHLTKSTHALMHSPGLLTKLQFDQAILLWGVYPAEKCECLCFSNLTWATTLPFEAIPLPILQVRKPRRREMTNYLPWGSGNDKQQHGESHLGVHVIHLNTCSATLLYDSFQLTLSGPTTYPQMWWTHTMEYLLGLKKIFSIDTSTTWMSLWRSYARRKKQSQKTTDF